MENYRAAQKKDEARILTMRKKYFDKMQSVELRANTALDKKRSCVIKNKIENL